MNYVDVFSRCRIIQLKNTQHNNIQSNNESSKILNDVALAEDIDIILLKRTYHKSQSLIFFYKYFNSYIGATTINIMTFSIIILIVTLSINDINHHFYAVLPFNIMISVVILCLIMLTDIIMSVLVPKQYQVYWY